MPNLVKVAKNDLDLGESVARSVPKTTPIRATKHVQAPPGQSLSNYNIFIWVRELTFWSSFFGVPDPQTSVFGKNMPTGSSFRCRTLWGSSRISRTQHWKLLKLSQSLYHIIIQLPCAGKCLTRKWRDARASLVSKCSDPAPPRSRRGLELPPKISSFRGISYS